MGTGDLTGDLLVADYLSRLDGALPLPARDRKRIVTEAADGLACAIEDAVAGGESPGAAARSAVAEFGRPGTLAAHFAAALAPAKARRTGLALVLTGPVIGLVWVAAAGQGTGWPARIGSLIEAMPYLPLVLGLTVAAAVAAVVAGWNPLRLNVSGRSAVTAAWLSTLGCVVADVLLLTGATVGGTAGGWATWTAAALSGVRLTAAATACRSLSRLRVAGYRSLPGSGATPTR